MVDGIYRFSDAQIKIADGMIYISKTNIKGDVLPETYTINAQMLMGIQFTDKLDGKYVIFNTALVNPSDIDVLISAKYQPENVKIKNEEVMTRFITEQFPTIEAF